VGKTFAEDAAFSLFLPVHLSHLLFPSLHKHGLIICKVLEEKDRDQGTGNREQGSGNRDQGTEKACWLRFVVSHTFAKCAKGWGTQLCGMVKLLKYLGCAIRLVEVRGAPLFVQCAKGWGTQLYVMVKLLKYLGCATRQEAWIRKSENQ
jgi:hypothetical protein